MNTQNQASAAQTVQWTAQREIDGGSGIHVFHRVPNFGESYWTRIDGQDGLAVALVLGPTDAEVSESTTQILRALNSHADLMAALKRTKYLLAVQADVYKKRGWADTPEIDEVRDVVRAAIARAEGRRGAPRRRT